MTKTFYKKSFLVELEHFKGSLLELVHLCKVEEVNPLFVRLQEIAKQMDPKKILNDFSLGPEFIELYTHLIYLKSKVLLPRSEEAEKSAPNELSFELLEKIETYFQIKSTLSFLEKRQERQALSFPRGIEIQEASAKERIPQDPLFLHSLLKQALKQTKTNQNTLFKSLFSIGDEISKITSFCKNHSPLRALRLFSSCSSNLHVIVVFLAILELIKEGKGALEKNGETVYFIYREKKT